MGVCCGACAAETRDLGDSDSDSNETPVPEDGGQPTSQTRELACVSSAAMEGDENVPFVWRATASIWQGTTVVGLVRAPQFRSHAGVAVSAGEAFSVPVTVIEDETGLALLGDEYPPLSIELERQGAFFTGEFERGDASGTFLCWDTPEVFGSPWAQRPSVFPARFDAALGVCVDAEGAPATNDLPIAFVRETAFGECADLRDVALNDEDYATPDLALNLRGALLDGATLHFANLSAALQGARLRKFVFGYAKITGSIDAFTELPIGEGCSVVESTWAGNQVTCVQ
jgi:hypothetical protein